MVINYLAIALGTALNIALAKLWYGFLFNDLWRSLTNRTANEKPAKLQMFIALIFALLMSMGVNSVVQLCSITDMAHGVLMAAIIGIFIVTPIILGEWIWDKKSLTLVLLNTGFYVIYLVATFSIFMVL